MIDQYSAALELPDPPYPDQVDLRDYQFYPLDVVRLRDSGLASHATGDEFRAAVLLWSAAWHQVPAGTLPDDNVDLAKYAGYGRVVKEWLRVRTGALRGWWKAKNGLLYHDVVSEKVKQGWRSKLEQRWQTECGRLKKHCQRHALAFERPTFDEWLAVVGPLGQLPYVSGDEAQMSPGHTGNVPGKTAPTEVKGSGSGSEGTSKTAIVENPDTIARAGDSQFAVGRNGHRKKDRGQQWGNPAWVAATGKTYAVARHQTETDDAYRDRVATVVAKKMREAEAETKRRSEH